MATLVELPPSSGVKEVAEKFNNLVEAGEIINVVVAAQLPGGRTVYMVANGYCTDAMIGLLFRAQQDIARSVDEAEELV